jgi:hypothetical protein
MQLYGKRFIASTTIANNLSKRGISVNPRDIENVGIMNTKDCVKWVYFNVRTARNVKMYSALLTRRNTIGKLFHNATMPC